MTPINEGMYEFKNDSLIEIRKRMGISQSKMAEFLGVPANTLSRWETGTTVPDAGALAAIYSLAKDKGIDNPSFFGIRKSRLEIKMSSEPFDQHTDSLTFFQSFEKYLSTHIEQIGTELAPVIKIEILNKAPSSPEWPKIVFTGVGVSLANTGGDDRAFLPRRLNTRISRKSEEEPDEIPMIPWQHTKKELLKITYNRIDRNDFPDITRDEMQHGEVLFPGESVVYEMDVTMDSLPYIQFKVEGTVSRRHLLHFEETFVMPENITKPLAITAFNDFLKLNLYGPLESVIHLMPKFDDTTRLEEVQTFSKVISESITSAKETQEELNNVFRQHKMYWLRAHLRSAFIYLDRVVAALERMNEAIGSNSPEKIVVEVSAILALKGESAQLDRETQELMHANNISEEEVKRSQLDQIKATVATSTKIEPESSIPDKLDIPDELDLHGKTVNEAIPLVDTYLEDSYNAGKKQVWIVHGKGTGVLRQAVREHLSKHRLVKAHRLADNSHGGDGATQVDLID